MRAGGQAMHDSRPPAIALMGPTASGKSALALDWARRLGGEIVSVDSALVYRGLDIGAAKPTAGELAEVPHHLVDLRDPWQAYSAAGFAADARAAIDGIRSEEHTSELQALMRISYDVFCLKKKTQES